MASLRRAGRLIASAGILALLSGFMWFFHIADYPYLASALTGSLIIYLWTRPGIRSLTITVLCSGAFALLYSFAKGEAVWGSALAFLGLGSIAHLSLTSLWRDPPEREAHLETCLKASMFPLFLAIAGFAMAVTTIVHPKTYDLFLYAFDVQLGGSPSFLVGRVFARFGTLRQICYTGYESLPLAMAIAFALDGKRPGRSASGIMTAFTVAATGGFALYNFYPANGPVHIFGEQFPFAVPAPMMPPFSLVAPISGPRNAMPSVHLTMALLILWNSRRWAAGWRILAGALLTVTVLATLGLGEHYLVDLLVAVPFALVAQGVAASGTPWYGRERIAAVGAGGTLVAAWLVYLRLPSPPLHGNGRLAWGLLTATAVAGVCLEWRLEQASVAGYRCVRAVEAVTTGETALATTL